MTSVLLGLLTALCWGGADVFARYTSRALSAQGALLGMMTVSLTGVSLWMVALGDPWPGWPSWWTVGSSSLAALSMLLFYEAMRRGPVSMVSPAVGAYPAWTVLITMLMGVRPTWGMLGAMALTMTGVLLVARFAAAEPDPHEAPNRRTTLLLALIASVLFGGLVLMGQQAVLHDGSLKVVWWGRATGALLLIGLLLIGPRPARPPLRPLLVAGIQGSLDTTGLLVLFSAGAGIEGALASVSSSAFGVVTVLLARLFYKERIASGQGWGIAAVFAGVIALAAQGSVP